MSTLLPDALLFDDETGVFWIVEAVHSDGPITEERKGLLLERAATHSIPASQIAFLTAFESRNAHPAKRLLKSLAAGTFAWFRDEPGYELRLDVIDDGSTLAPVTVLKSKTK